MTRLLRRLLRPRLLVGAASLLLAAGLAVGAWAITHHPAAPGRHLKLPASLPRSNRSHVVVIVLENRSASEAIGNPEAPYISRLAHRYALATRYYGVTHPSLPNYLALTGGSTFGIESDCTGCSVNASNIVDQLEAHRISWRAYMEGMRRPCDRTSGEGGYAKKHDPFLYYEDVAFNLRRCRKVVPFGRLRGALAHDRLPTFAWITPNLCDDGHDCGLSDVNSFLKGIVPALIRELGPHGALLLTWDEGEGGEGCCEGQAAGGRVATILIGPDARRGARVDVPYDHYSILRTIEDMLGLRHLRLAGSPASRPLGALFAGGRPPALRGKAR